MLEKIAQIIGEQLGVDPATINADTDIIKDLGADSLDVVELLMTLEESEGKTIPEEQVQNIKTVGDIAKVLETL